MDLIEFYFNAFYGIMLNIIFTKNNRSFGGKMIEGVYIKLLGYELGYLTTKF